MKETEETYNKYLPIGSVIRLKDAEKRMMIVGFLVKKDDSDDKIYDYLGCLYPEGLLSSKINLIFNHEQIEKVYSLGYADQESVDFHEKLNNKNMQ